MKSRLDAWKNTGKSGGSSSVSGDQMKEIVVPIANILTAIGVFVLVGVTIVMGIKIYVCNTRRSCKTKNSN